MDSLPAMSTRCLSLRIRREFAAIARKGGAEVPFLRPGHLASDTAASVDVILHAVDYLEGMGERFSLLVLLEPTSPLRKPEDIDKALEFLLSGPEAERRFSFAHGSASSGVSYGKPGFSNRFSLTSKSSEDRIFRLFFLDGTVYISWIDALRRRRSFYHDKTLGYEVPKYQSFEVDDIDDFIICEALYRAKFVAKE